MRRMRQQVQENNIYRWAGSLLTEAGKLLEAAEPSAPMLYVEEAEENGLMVSGR